MQTKTLFTMKTDKKLKAAAQKAAEEIGVPLSTVVNAFLRQFARDKEVTFSARPYRMTPYLEHIIEATQRDFKQGKNSSKVFDNAKDLIKDLNS